jgi:hypothetical protein
MNPTDPLWIAATVMVQRGYPNSYIEKATGLYKRYIREIRANAVPNKAQGSAHADHTSNRV